jgi:hypothetical protein
MAKPQLVCPAGSLAALKAAVDNGADDVYLGFRNDTNARNFAGLNFDDKAVAEGIRYAHQRGCKVLVAINTYAQAGRFADWTRIGGQEPPTGRRRRDHRRPGGARLRDEDPSADAPPPVGAGFRHQLRGHQFLPREVRHPARRAAARADPGPGRERDPQHRSRDRGVRFRQPLRDERGALLVVVLCHGRIAQHGRRLLAGQVRAMGKEADRNGRAPQRHPHRPLRQRRERRLPDHLQGALRSRRRDLLRDGGTGQPQRAGNAAGDHSHRRRRDQGRGPPAQPDLCRAGHPQPAPGARCRIRRTGEIQCQAGLGGGTGQGRRRFANNLGAYNRPWR